MLQLCVRNAYPLYDWWKQFLEWLIYLVELRVLITLSSSWPSGHVIEPHTRRAINRSGFKSGRVLFRFLFFFKCLPHFNLYFRRYQWSGDTRLCLVTPYICKLLGNSLLLKNWSWLCVFSIVNFDDNFIFESLYCLNNLKSFYMQRRLVLDYNGLLFDI